MNKYKDIINLPHHVSKTRKPMSLYNRAAQFAPFAALTGYDDAIKEIARLTNERIEINDELREIINFKVQMIKEQIGKKPSISVTYFIPDKTKNGGEYKTINGIVKKINEYEKFIALENNQKIPMCEIISIFGDTIKIENDFYE